MFTPNEYRAAGILLLCFPTTEQFGYRMWPNNEAATTQRPLRYLNSLEEEGLVTQLEGHWQLTEKGDAKLRRTRQLLVHARMLTT